MRLNSLLILPKRNPLTLIAPEYYLIHTDALQPRANEKDKLISTYENYLKSCYKISKFSRNYSNQ